MRLVSKQTVRFAHIDAAGIVFYPRYFEMLNAAMEDFFAQIVGVSFSDMHFERALGVPTVKLETNFMAPSRLGDELAFELSVASVGRTSTEIAIDVTCDEQVRFRARVVLVCMDLKTARPVAWPDDMRPAPALAA